MLLTDIFICFVLGVGCNIHTAYSLSRKVPKKIAVVILPNRNNTTKHMFPNTATENLEVTR